MLCSEGCVHDFGRVWTPPDEVNRLLDQPTDMEQMIAFHRVRELADRGQITKEGLQRVRKSIRADMQEFRKLLQATPTCTEPVVTAAVSALSELEG